MRYNEVLAIMNLTNARLDRKSWQGSGRFIFIIAGDTWDFTTDVVGIDALCPATGAFICERTSTNVLLPWSPSPEDSFADDWRVIPEEVRYVHG